MTIVLAQKNDLTYIDVSQHEFVIDKESALNDLLSLCYEYESNFILLDMKNLADDFFDLKTGLAGAAMQKFANYQTRVAIVLSKEGDYHIRFEELMYEMNRNEHFRFFEDRELAEDWLSRG